jgi:hypothetical protein
MQSILTQNYGEDTGELSLPVLLRAAPSLSGLRRLRAEWMNGIQFFLKWKFDIPEPFRAAQVLDEVRFHMGCRTPSLENDIRSLKRDGPRYAMALAQCEEAGLCESRQRFWRSGLLQWPLRSPPRRRHLKLSGAGPVLNHVPVRTAAFIAAHLRQRRERSVLGASSTAVRPAC